jgi:L,D-transpeptidase-like protein/putative peptidoglycan binding protein
MRMTMVRNHFIRTLIVILLLLVPGGILETMARKAARSSPQDLSKQERVEAEQRLWQLGYWAGPIDGQFDSASRHGLIAFQKVEQRDRTGKLTRDELNALRNARHPVPRFGTQPHVEIDLQRQVLFLIDETGSVVRILPVSTGNGQMYMDRGKWHRAVTPVGRFTVLRKIDGSRLSSLGLLYYPSYIHNGIAIHGSPLVPSYVASHGCIRVPMFAARELSSLLPVGMEVIVYDGGRAAHSQKRTVTAGDLEYVLDLPSPEWQAVPRFDVHQHFEFIYGNDPANGHLQIRKILVESGTTAADLFERDEKWELQRLAGYVVCSGAEFKGQHSGTVYSYEYVSGGRPMFGNVYYLQIDKSIFYSLRFAASRDKRPILRDQMDFIARSFHLKQNP